MNPSYDDITSRIAEPPVWWQEGGVPRWSEFTPRESSSIYAREAVLMEIECQACGVLFKVGMCDDGRSNDARIDESIISGRLHYGDPPNSGHHDGCSGASMNSVPRRILEYWSTHDSRYVENGIVKDHEKYFAWNRNELLEGQYDGWNGKVRPVMTLKDQR